MKSLILLMLAIGILGSFFFPFIAGAEVLTLTNFQYSRGAPGEMRDSYLGDVSGLDRDQEEILDLFMENPGRFMGKIVEDSLLDNLSSYWYSYNVLDKFA